MQFDLLDCYETWKSVVHDKRPLKTSSTRYKQRLENALWRKFGQLKYQIRNVNPTEVNWHREPDKPLFGPFDELWLYGPYKCSKQIKNYEHNTDMASRVSPLKKSVNSSLKPAIKDPKYLWKHWQNEVNSASNRRRSSEGNSTHLRVHACSLQGIFIRNQNMESSSTVIDSVIQADIIRKTSIKTCGADAPPHIQFNKKVEQRIILPECEVEKRLSLIKYRRDSFRSALKRFKVVLESDIVKNMRNDNFFNDIESEYESDGETRSLISTVDASPVLLNDEPLISTLGALPMITFKETAEIRYYETERIFVDLFAIARDYFSFGF